MEMTQRKIFAERLMLLREGKQLTQQQVADDMSIDRTTIARYETHKRIPTYEHLTAFAKYYDTTTDYLLGLSPSSKRESDITSACNYTGLSQENAELLHLLTQEKALFHDESSISNIEIISRFIDILDKFPDIFNNLKKISAVNDNKLVLKDLEQELKKTNEDLYNKIYSNGTIIVDHDYAVLLEYEVKRDLDLFISCLMTYLREKDAVLFDNPVFEIIYNSNRTLSALTKESVENGKHNSKKE